MEKMRVLLIDNSKPAIRVHTPRLVETLRDDLKCEVCVCETAEQVSAALALERRHDWDAVVLSGSSLNVSESLETSRIAKDLMVLVHMRDVALLGICFGMQLLAVANGGRVERLAEMQDGARRVTFLSESPLAQTGTVAAHFHHQDVVAECPASFVVDARCERDAIAAIRSRDGRHMGVQFHPEASEGDAGRALLERFLRVAQRYRVHVAPEVRISRDTYARIALSLGGAPPIQVAVQYGVEPMTVLAVWTHFRDRFRIPPMLV